ncbi:MAG: hypothetical protein M3380_21935, partial [Chloroflexota bacterium]|nr:hypothetical protein [Chloroflexota bacterium]
FASPNTLHMHDHAFRPLHAALVSLGLLIAAYGFTPAVTRVAGEQDGLVFRNFHALETGGGVAYHWSTGESTLALPQIGQPMHGLLRLRVWTPDARPSVSLTLSANRRTMGTLPIQGRRTIALLVPGSALTGGDIRLGLRSPVWNPESDPRAIGVGVEALGWQGLGWTFPPLRQLWTLPSLVLALALLLTRLHWSTGRASARAGLVGALLACGAALCPLTVAAYIQRLLWVAMLAHAGLLLWSALTREDRGWWRLPDRFGPGGLLLLGIA